MRNKKTDETGCGLDLVLQELKENPYKKFNIAFALMSIIPFLVFVYILTVRLFTLDIFFGDIGAVVFISMMVSLLGFSAGSFPGGHLVYLTDSFDLTFSKAVFHEFIVGRIMFYPVKNDIYLVETHTESQCIVNAL